MSQIKSIKCTNCAAPLNLFGGGRVETMTCTYCKSVLDLNDNYKVLSNFKNVKELHELPFKIGMKAELKGIHYTIIGRVTYQHLRYIDEEWTDFLLFSPLYGYAWLTYEDGHLLYSRRNRTFPNIAWSEIHQHIAIGVGDKSFVPFDNYKAVITYVEGELTWVAKRNDKTSFIDLCMPPYGISVEKSGEEIEYYETEYLDASSTYEAFNLSPKEKSKSFHALQPFERPFLKSLSFIAYWVMFIIALFALGTSIDGSGKFIKNISADNTKVTISNFTIKSSKYLIDLELQADKAKELNNFNLQVHQDKKLIFSLTPMAAYTFKETNNQIDKKLELWEKNAKKVRVLLNLDEKNTYQLTITPIDQNLSSSLFVKVEEAHSKLNYLKWFFILTLLLWFIYKFLSWRYQNKLEEERGIYHDDDLLSEYYKYGSSTWNKSWGDNHALLIAFYLVIFSLLIILEYND
jgi:hypothetical protein